MSTASEIARFLELRPGGPPSLDEAIRWRSAGGSAETEALLRDHASRPDTEGSAAPLLVQWLGWQGRIEEAYRVLEHWLLENGAFTLTHLTTRLSRILGIAAAPIEARYVLHRDAMQSLGAWHHVTTSSGPEQHILTKIIHEAHAGNEPLFYHRIRPIHSDLHGITPRLIDIFHLPGMPVILLSMTMVPGTPCDTSHLSSEQQKIIALACRMICDTPLGALRSILPDGEQRFGYSHGYLVSALSNIHLASNWARIDEWIRTALLDRDYPERIATLVRSSLDDALRGAFHARINPERHYAFQHGDLHRHNVLITGTSVMLVDWARCTIGPRGADLAVLFRRYGYTHVRDLAVQHGIIPKDDMVADGLIATALLLVSLQIDLDAIKCEPLELLFLPACRALSRASVVE